MPQGQTTGPRRYFRYTDDDGAQSSVLLDETLGELGGLVLDDNLPPPPRRFRLRGVYVQGTVAGEVVRKFIVCAPDSGLYRSNNSQPVAIDGVTFRTTGRRGERLSFGRNPIVGP